MKQVWGIGKRKFERNWERRIWLFDTLVWTVMGYGAEIWGWEERKEIEAIQERYIKWTLGVDWGTPGYMVREEVKRDKMRTRAGRRAWKYEEKLRKGEGSEIARECLEEIRGRERREGQKISWWEEGRKGMRGRGGRGEGEEGADEEYERVEKQDKREQEWKRWEGIRQSRYNRWYREVRVEGIPRYMKEGWREDRYKRIARFRMGNEIRESRYWEREEKRMCRVCGGEIESWEHVLDRCSTRGEVERGLGERIREILDEGGGGEEWMKNLEGKRNERMDKEEGAERVEGETE